MPQNTTYRQIVYRLLPGTQSVARQLAGQAGACRFVWNEMLARHKAGYEEAKAKGEKSPSVSVFSLNNRFAELRREVPWLSDYSFKITRYTMKYQADAWKAAFKGGGFPRFKSRNNTTPSFTIPEDVKIKDGKIRILKIGWLAMRRKGEDPYTDGRPVKAVVRKVAGKWYVTVCYAVEAPEIVDTGVAAGVDMNVRQVAVATTDGKTEIIHAPDTGFLDTKIKRNQRMMARQRKGSRRRLKTKMRLQRLHRKRANVRRNWHHQTSRRIADNAHTVCVEDLNTKAMAQGVKTGLSRGIMDTGWGALQAMITYKAAVIEVDPAYTSQTCAECGTIDAKSRKTQADFECVACGHADNADLNAARNILASGIGAAARRGAFGLPTPMTREIDAKDV